MGFFDNLGKAISDAGNSALQKGKDAANVAKFNRLITEEERETGKLFEQLGRKFFESQGSEAGEEYSEIVEAIGSSLEKIKGYQATIKELQGIITCESCGNDIPVGASFCPECGAKVPVVEAEIKKEEDPSKLYCKECGNEIAPGTKFCMNCGTKVEITEVIEPEEKDAISLEGLAQTAEAAADTVAAKAEEAVEYVKGEAEKAVSDILSKLDE